MKHLILRSLREIRSTKAQFLSIIAIIGVGSAIFSGLFSMITLISSYLNTYYLDYKLASAWVYVKAIDPVDLEAYRSEFPDLNLEARQFFEIEGVLGGQTVTYRFYTKTDINGLKLEDGTYPIKQNEILMDASFAAKNGLGIGDTIDIPLDGTDEVFTVTGLFDSPEFAYKSKDFSDASSNKKGFGILYSTSDTLYQLNTHTKIYLEAKATLEDELASAQTKLDDAYRKLSDARTTYNRKRSEVLSDLSAKQTDLSQKADSLSAQRASLIQNRDALNAGQTQVNDGIVSLESALGVNATTLDAQEAGLDSAYANNLVDATTYQTTKGAYAQLRALYTQQTQLAQQASALAQGLSQLDEGLVQINDGLTQLSEGIDQATRDFDAAKAKIDANFRTYEKNLAEFERNKAEALDTLASIPDKIFEILVKGSDEKTNAFVEALKRDEVYAQHLMRADHPAYAMVNNILKPIEVMTTIFPILFFVVASIVILISMSKTIENERTQIAIFKGLGLPVSSIVLSYLFYGWWAALAGSVPFALLGNWIIPKVLLAIFTTRFSFPPIELVYYPLYIGIAIGLALFFASVAILMALRPILREIPAQGMRPKPPKGTKRSWLESWPWMWNRLSYTNKLIVRNILMGKVKLLLSSIGIIGSVALLITGLSLQRSANVMIDNNIASYNFQYAITLDPDQTLEDVAFPIEISKIEGVKVIQAKIGSNALQLQLLKAHETLIDLRDDAGHPIDLGPDSVVVSKILALLYDLAPGSELTVVVDDKDVTLKVGAVSNQYLGKTVTLTFNQAQRLGLDTQTHRYYLATPDGSASEEGRQALLDQEAIIAVDTKAKSEAVAHEMLAMLNNIIAIIVLSALILSVTVIYNMASISIFERQRELATLRVLGYTIREVGHLVFSENYLLMVLGAIGGVPAGLLLYQTIAHLVSTPEFMMNDSAYPEIVALSVFAGFLFTFLTNRLLNRKIKRIQFVESLKGVE